MNLEKAVDSNRPQAFFSQPKAAGKSFVFCLQGPPRFPVSKSESFLDEQARVGLLIRMGAGRGAAKPVYRNNKN